MKSPSSQLPIDKPAPLEFGARYFSFKRANQSISIRPSISMAVDPSTLPYRDPIILPKSKTTLQ